MTPRGTEGLDVQPILTHYVFLFTTILSAVGWIIAFITQAIVTSRYGRGPVGSLWFAIFLQLFLIIGVLYTLASDSVAMHRLQISIFGAIAVVFAVGGVDAGLFSKDRFLIAMSTGWFILTIVDLVWLLYFTSDENSRIFYLYNYFGTGGLTPPSRRRRATRVQSMHNMSNNNGYATNYASGGGVMSGAGYDAKIETGMGSARDGSGPAARSQNSLRVGSPIADMTRNSGATGTGAGSMSNVNVGDASTNAGLEPHSPLMGGGAAGLGAGGPAATTSIGESTQSPDAYLPRAKALYAYTANPEDPNEISFAKGEILDVLDKQGKWWQAKKSDGSIGIAPSNYLQLI